VSPDEEVSRGTLSKIVALAKERPLVYLPSHDPESEERLVRGLVIEVAEDAPVATHSS